MKGKQDLLSALRAGYSFFYIQSYDLNSTVEKVEQAVREFEYQGKNLFNTLLWDMESGEDPEGALAALEELDPWTVMVATNYSWFLKDYTGDFNKPLCQFILNRTEKWASVENRHALVIVGTDPMNSAIPECLKREFIEVEFPLPDVGEIKAIYDFIVDSVQGSEDFVEPTEEEARQIQLNSRGLNEREIRNAYSYTLVKNKGKFDPKEVGRIQAREVGKTAGLNIGEYPEAEEPLGMDNIKSFILNTFKSVFALGLLFCGPPGTGKTMLAKWVGKISGLKVIEMNMAELFGSLVGESEKMMRQALDVVKANAPCILFIDEIEKGLAGIQTAGGSIGDEVAKRSMGQFLKFLSDERPDGLYVLATCNNIDSMPPEYLRAERWDTAPFFIDLPNWEERKTILSYYKSKFNVEGELTEAQTDGWSGAELKTVCRIATMMGKKIDKVCQFVVPVAKTMSQEINRLRKRAESAMIPASTKVPNGSKKEKGKRATIL